MKHPSTTQTRHVGELFGATEDFCYPLSLWIRLELDEFICYFTRLPKKICYLVHTTLSIYIYSLPAPATKHQSLKQLLLSANHSKKKKKKSESEEVLKKALSKSELRALVISSFRCRWRAHLYTEGIKKNCNIFVSNFLHKLIY